ncbi:hypothetical protein [Actinokineospora sp.]|uniref:hypothetical protein n=1 Tax=Actinokineospora sp. TaxID=1872133 RepID=UPI004037AC71
MPPEHKTFHGRRHPTGTNGGTPYTIYDVADGCTVTLFDDGRVRMTMKPDADWAVEVKETDARFPGAKMLELKPKASKTPTTRPTSAGFVRE